MMLCPGSTFGRYTVVRLLGQGGMGTVYLVRHDVLETEFALKVLSADVEGRTGLFVQRFIREAKLSCRIRHPNLVVVHDAGLDAATGLYYIVMDYMPGGTLRDRMLREPSGMSVGDALRIAKNVAAALAAAAKFGMVHRDIKPDNVMFDAQGVARLADLGIAKLSGTDDSIVTMANTVFGTPAYMSPEQARDSGKVDARADIYSLGIVLYEMLCGIRPYKEGSPLGVMAQVISPNPIPDVRQQRPDLPESVARLVADMCEKNVRRRIASAADLYARIKQLLSEMEMYGAQSTIVSGVGLAARGRSGVRRLWMITTFAATMLLTVGIAWWLHDAARTPASGNAPAREIPKSPTVEPSKPPSPASSAEPSARPLQKAASGPSESTQPTASARQPIVSAQPAAPVKQPVVSARPVTPSRQSVEKPPEPPAPPEVQPGSVVVLGDGSDASLTLGQAAVKDGPLVALEAENPARLMRQIDDMIAKKPSHVYLRLGNTAETRGISPENFEYLLLAAADRLREKNVPFTCVIDPDTDGNARYNVAVRDVCKLRSYECRQLPQGTANQEAKK